MNRLIEAPRSIVLAADVSMDKLAELMDAICEVKGIYAIKIGITLETDMLLAVKTIRLFVPELKIIHDHQKAGNDIPDMGAPFAKTMKNAGVDAVILFPFAGPKTQEAWTKACFDEGLEVLTGGIMTHPEFLVSEGGYIDDSAVEKIYRLACKLGVRNFVVPGTKLSWVKKIYGILVDELGEGNFDLYAPGLITQGGEISECGMAAGPRFHGIVGRAIFDQPTVELMRQAAITVTSKITA